MSAKEKVNRVTVRIANDEYIIKGSAESGHIEKVASYVDLQMKQFYMKNAQLSPTKIAVLTALNIADELLRLQEDYEALIKMLDENQMKKKS